MIKKKRKREMIKEKKKGIKKMKEKMINESRKER